MPDEEKNEAAAGVEQAPIADGAAQAASRLAIRT